MNWISVKDKLPVIPTGKYAIQVLVAEFDSIFEEINPGHGYTVRQVTYGRTTDRNGKIISKEFEGSNRLEKDFMEIYYGMDGDICWGPINDEITHWVYLPNPPTYITDKCEGCEAIGYCNDSR